MVNVTMIIIVMRRQAKYKLVQSQAWARCEIPWVHGNTWLRMSSLCTWIGRRSCATWRDCWALIDWNTCTCTCRTCTALNQYGCCEDGTPGDVWGLSRTCIEDIRASYLVGCVVSYEAKDPPGANTVNKKTLSAMIHLTFDYIISDGRALYKHIDQWRI